MKHNNLPDATVVISHWHATCNNCGHKCDFNEKTHKTNLGWTASEREGEGCGIEFTHVAAEYAGENGIVQRCRPDLELADPYGPDPAE